MMITLEKISSILSLNKSKKTFKKATRLYRQKEKTLNEVDKQLLQQLLTTLQEAIIQKNSTIAKQTAEQLEDASQKYMPRSLFDKARDFVGAILFALIIAIAVRQMWFEFYSIPTGSMRPTLKEGDYLVVSKTDFGINTPFRSGHFYFDPALVERGSIVIFTGENMDMPDDDTMYFYVIPGKKQYIKRLIGKPGDTLYFYGGEIYGMNARGRDLKELRDPSYFQNIEHIPYIRFEGKVETPGNMVRGVYPTSIIYQMGQPVAKLYTNAMGAIHGEMLVGNKSRPYADLWGFKNYGMSRLLTAEQVKKIHPEGLADLDPHLEHGLLYLEISHHPSLQGAKLIRDEQGRFRPTLGSSTSILPLTQTHLTQILAHMTTCRFEVKNGIVYRFGSGYEGAQYRPTLPGVPDGLYEMQNGVAREVITGGISKQLDPKHPLLAPSPEQIQTLYNFGFEWSNYFAPSAQAPMPSRYAYFHSGDLYLMGGSVMNKGDPLLTLFLKREYQKQAMSTSVKPYHPFDDARPPLSEDGKLDTEFIRQYGLTIPEKMYLVMGDNHAMSADSRQFGFVPQSNLRGGASFLFWPAGDRWGRLPQALTAHLTVPNLAVISLAAIISLCSYVYIQRKYFKRFKF